MTRHGFRRLAAGLVLLVSAAGCGSPNGPHPTAPTTPPATAQATRPVPLSAAELRTHLLPAALPGGWTSEAEPPRESPKGAPAGSATPPSCEALLDGQSVVDAGTATASASATAMFSGGHSAGNGVIPGMEKLYSFADGGAHRALEDMRALVGRCRTVELPHAAGEPADTAAFAIAEGPRLGDESLVVQAAVTGGGQGAAGGTQHADATVVRVGNALVVISSVLTLTPEEAGTVAGFMPTAVAQVVSDHPEPVGGKP
ncbi:hypothetical protein ACFWJT_19170 [Streptomyces sp. NPDC127069]|uniref:hypothetical protein n=1 Tax=Streptomyces sp. NPDC127069 TaxID=3347128 RepID=UPI00365C3665